MTAPKSSFVASAAETANCRSKVAARAGARSGQKLKQALPTTNGGVVTSLTGGLSSQRTSRRGTAAASHRTEDL